MFVYQERKGINMTCTTNEVSCNPDEYWSHEAVQNDTGCLDAYEAKPLIDEYSATFGDIFCIWHGGEYFSFYDEEDECCSLTVECLPSAYDDPLGIVAYMFAKQHVEEWIT
jgi:hypothetical protein